MNLYCRGLAILLTAFACNSTAIDTELPDVPNALSTLQLYGDSRDGPEIYAELLKIGYTHFPKGPIIHLGDMISSPRHTEQYRPFIELTKLYANRNEFHVTIGNHDVDNLESMSHATRVFPEVGQHGYYSKKIGNCFCVFLNSEDLSTSAEGLGADQIAWLRKELSSDASRQSRFRFVMVHRPLYPQNQHKDEPLAGREELHQLFIETNVDMVIAGHEHSYSHQVKDSIHYLITGGGGSPLFKGGGPSAFFHYVQMFELENELKFYAIDFLGRTKDEFQVDIRPR